MADLNTVIQRFLSDAQYRIAELAIEIDNGKRNNLYVGEQIDLRAELIQWVNILFDPNHRIKDNINFLYDWTDTEIIAECEYLRAKAGMNEIPWITFAGYTPEILNNVIGGGDSGGGGTIPPTGTPGNFLLYNSNGNLVSTPFPTIGGQTNETIDQYFS